LIVEPALSEARLGLLLHQRRRHGISRVAS
jgi:hypothetical protein